MNLTSLLALTVDIAGDVYQVSLSWLGELIKNLISSASSVGVGIILFSLILRLVVLPFDIYQRFASRKQNQKMAENKDKLDKLQKQYANDKNMYNQKMTELYKENGISMFSSCLPAILSIVIFFVAIGAFQDFSKYANLQNYNDMATFYNSKIVEFQEDGYIDEETFELDGDKLISDKGEENVKLFLSEHKEQVFDILQSDFNTYQETKFADFDFDGWYSDEYTTKDQKAISYVYISAMDNVLAHYDEIEKNVRFLWIKNIWQTDASFKHPVLSYTDFSGQVASASGCSCSCSSGGKTLWRFDETTGEKIEKTFDELKNQGSSGSIYTERYYARVTGSLENKKSEANGYYILILLSIGTILLQQFVNMRSQKEQQKYSSVDGQGQANSKMMLITMTVMFAIFAFIYTSAFSIYMITGNLMSLLTTVVINKIVDKIMKNAEQKQLQAKYERRFRSQNKGAKNNKK